MTSAGIAVTLRTEHMRLAEREPNAFGVYDMLADFDLLIWKELSKAAFGMMQHRSHKYFSLLAALFLCVITSVSATNYKPSQGPENDELFQLVNQIRQLQQAKMEKQAIPMVERA